MRIILCDDDTQFMQSFSKQLFSILQKHGVIPKVILTHTGLDALREITHQPTDVLFSISIFRFPTILVSPKIAFGGFTHHNRKTITSFIISTDTIYYQC